MSHHNNNNKRKSDEDISPPNQKRLKLNNDEPSNNVSPLQCFVNHKQVLIAILTFLPYRYVVNSCSLVNRYFNSVVFEQDTWQQICKHQSVYFDVTLTPLISTFIQTCKPPNIELHIKKENKKIKKNPLLRAVNAVTLFEPFVKTLTIDAKPHSAVMRELETRITDRKIYPNLEYLRPTISWVVMKKVFGPDLSRFKELDINDAQIQYNRDLQRITLQYCGKTEVEILTENLHILKNIQFKEFPAKYNKECINCIIPIVETLSMNLREKTMINPIEFPNLRELDISADVTQVKRFLSRSHPNLMNIKINIFSRETQSHKLAVQPSVRSIQYTGPSELINEMLKQVVNADRIKKLVICIDKNSDTSISSSFNVDISQFSQLEEFELNGTVLINHLVKKNMNNLSTLIFSKECNLNPIVDYLSNLSYLKVHTMDLDTFTRVMKLPRLNTLHVNTMQMTYATFTKWLHDWAPTHNPSSIREYNIGRFLEDDQKQPIYIIAPLKCLTINQPISISKNHSKIIEWLLFVASTIRVKTVDYSTVTNLAVSINDMPWNHNDILTSQAADLINELRKTLEYILEDNRYLVLDNMDRTLVINTFEKMFQKKQYRDYTKRHPAIDHLFKYTNCI
jgi:hypothetical protein